MTTWHLRPVIYETPPTKPADQIRRNALEPGKLMLNVSNQIGNTHAPPDHRNSLDVRRRSEQQRYSHKYLTHFAATVDLNFRVQYVPALIRVNVDVYAKPLQMFPYLSDARADLYVMKCVSIR